MHVRRPSDSVKLCYETTAVTDPLAALNERYRASLPEKRSAIMAAFSAWRADLGELEHLRGVNRLLHKLAGSAGGYGYARLGESARAADGLLYDWLSDAPSDIAQRSAFLLDIEPLMHAIDDLFDVAVRESRTDIAGDVRGLMSRPIRVLLVDDDSELANLLIEKLRHEGIDVLAAGDGAGMHLMLSQARPDVLVLDFWLRNETGDDLARSVRSTPGLSNLPAVCLTSDRTPETRQRALIAGALEVIDKSTPPNQLAGLLRMFADRAA
jgi:CheY-like chemotaxis protein/HPt (histidine-containing phosphotransfer) domain-containing protein